MNSAEFVKTATAAAQKYHRFLSNSSKTAGISRIAVLSVLRSRISPCVFKFCLERAPYRLDQCYIEFYGKEASGIEIIRPDASSSCDLIVRVDAKLVDDVLNAPYGSLFLASDMRFLVRRLWDFYAGHSLNLTPPAPCIPIPSRDELPLELSDNQYAAVHTALTSPVSYIWGAPGTGKTRYVLSSCLLQYARNGQRVLLLAPTNNAVEQVLFGVLPVLEEAGLSRDLVYRVGISSGKFAHAYPDLVADTAVSKLYEEAREKISKLQAELDGRKSYDERVAQSDALLFDLSCDFDTAIECLSEFRDAHLAYNSAVQEHKDLLKKQSKWAALLAQSKSSLEKVQEQLSTLSENVNKLQSRLCFLRFLPWAKGTRLRLSQELANLLVQEAQLSTALKEHQEQIDFARSNYMEYECLISSSRTTADRRHCDRDSILGNAIAACRHEYTASVLSSLQKLDDESIAGPQTKPHIESKLIDYLTTAKKNHADLIASCTFRVEEEIMADLTSQESVLSDLAKNPSVRKQCDARIVAGTFDSILKYLPKDDGDAFAHIFVDEAGYTSLMRGLTVFSCNAPVTFLGDHYQLPPICEMRKLQEENSEVCLWALPVVYFADLCLGDLSDLFSIYETREKKNDFPPPRLDLPYLMAYSPLLESYRFSDSLASILDTHVYHTHGAFRGLSASSLDITILHTPRIPTSKLRQSPAEADHIFGFLEARPDIKNSCAILAPYNDQVDILRRKIRHMDISTVHRSQGQEYSTIILSVVDTNNKFFCNSSIPTGRFVLNTAISRAKEHIVLACDTSYWLEDENQLISALIAETRKKGTDSI